VTSHAAVPGALTKKSSPISVFGDIEGRSAARHRARQRRDHQCRHAIWNIEVPVPDGVEVDVGGFTLFGSKKIAVRGLTSGWSPATVRVWAFALFGSVKVWSP
jgi:hypothetical protein